MRKIVTVAQMRAIDAAAIRGTGIPGVVLMEHAGYGCAESICEMLGGAAGKKVAVISGKGNNGGDGFVIARWLVRCGAQVTVFLLAKRNEVKGDARINLDILCKLKIPVKPVRRAAQITGLCTYHLIVDAILGTGLSSAPRGLSKDVIDRVNRQRVPVMSVDGPSGLDMDTGQPLGSCIRAARTATMACPKPGLLVPPGLGLAGDLHVVEIGVPAAVMERHETGMSLIERRDAEALLPVRPADAHKGTCGSVGVAGGSAGMTGAIALTALATLKVGAGKTVLGVPAGIQSVLARKVTEVMTKPLAETGAKSLGLAALDGLTDLEQWADVMIFGPGISRQQETGELARTYAVRCKKQVVIDADALSALAAKRGTVKKIKGPAVLTPHLGEFARLAGKTVKEIEADRTGYLQRYARQNRCIMVLKGHPTITADPGGNLYFNSTGNAGMATAGSGDVLAGVIGGLAAQRMNLLDAAVLGVYIHGLAGDLAAAKTGKMGMTAKDILKYVPIALKQTGG